MIEANTYRVPTVLVGPLFTGDFRQLTQNEVEHLDYFKTAVEEEFEGVWIKVSDPEPVKTNDVFACYKSITRREKTYEISQLVEYVALESDEG